MKPRRSGNGGAKRRKASASRAPGSETGSPEVTTLSGIPLKPIYGPEDLKGFDPAAKLGHPGEYPFTRGVYPTMYRGRLWTMRQFAGFGTAADTNARFKHLLALGQTGLSTAFDFPTLLGYDSDSPRAKGEVGRCGVAIDSREDMERLFDGIPLGGVSTSMTINAPASILLAFYLCVAEKQGVPFSALRGTTQNDLLKEFHAQNTWIYGPGPSLRIVTDIIEFCAKEVPKWNTISISGYHIREAGATAAQELAFTLADGLEYVRLGVARGLDVDAFAPRLSFFFDAHIDFFEEIAKFRAARRIWAREMKHRFKARNPESMRLRFHTQTAGVSLTAQQPENNIVRTTIEAMAGVLGGTQSLHTNAMDETLALPTERSAQIALRTQQLIALESGIPSVADPLAGSYFMEALTDEMEAQAYATFDRIAQEGGMLKAIESNFFRKEIGRSARRFQRDVESGARKIVGVNCLSDGKDPEEGLSLLKIDPAVEERQRARLAKLRRTRDGKAVERRLTALSRAAAGTRNLFPFILDAARARATEGEIISAMEEVFGRYKEPVLV